MNDTLPADRNDNTSGTDAGDDKYRAPALDKGLDILELLAANNGAMTRTDITRTLKRSNSEIFRMLERLVQRQYVHRSPEGDRYSLSMKLFCLAHAHPPVDRLVAQAMPLMQMFASRTGQSCHLGMYDRGEVLIVAQINSPAPWGLSLRLGARINLMDTGSGHVLLAFADDEKRSRMMQEHCAFRRAEPRMTKALKSSLNTIQAQGYRQRESMQAPGVTDISVPVLDHRQQALATVTCPYFQRLDYYQSHPKEEVLESLLALGQKLSFTLAQNGGSDAP